jgi:hypothetical protein
LESPEITSQGVIQIRAPLLRQDEFATMTSTQILIYQIDLNVHRRRVHRYDIYTQSIRKFSMGCLAVQNHDLLFIDSGKCEEFVPRKSVNEFRVDNDTVITASFDHKYETKLVIANGPSFRVPRIITFGAADEWIANMLKSKVPLIVNCMNMPSWMHIQERESRDRPTSIFRNNGQSDLC